MFFRNFSRADSNKNISRRDRSFELKHVTIDLGNTKNTKRLVELCNQGKYKYHFFWDVFSNGIMMSCQIYYVLDGRRNVVKQESKFIFDKSVDEAKDDISLLLLQSLDLLEDKPNRKNESMDNLPIDEIKNEKISWAEELEKSEK